MPIEVRPGRGRCFIASRAYAAGEEVLREVDLLLDCRMYHIIDTKAELVR